MPTVSTYWSRRILVSRDYACARVLIVHAWRCSQIEAYPSTIEEDKDLLFKEWSMVRESGALYVPARARSHITCTYQHHLQKKFPHWPTVSALKVCWCPLTPRWRHATCDECGRIWCRDTTDAVCSCEQIRLWEKQTLQAVATVSTDSTFCL